MSNIKKSVFFLALFASTPLAISSPVTAETAAAAGATTENRALRALEDALYQDSLDNNFVGRQRANLAVDQFTDYSVGRVRAAALRSRKHAFALAAVDPERLNGNDLTTYRILKFELAGATMAEQAYWLTFDLTSYLAPGSFLSAQQVFAAHPLNTPQDVRHYIRLAESYATMLDTLTAKVAEQAQRGVYLPRPALPVIRGTRGQPSRETCARSAGKAARGRRRYCRQAHRSRLCAAGRDNWRNLCGKGARIGRHRPISGGKGRLPRIDPHLCNVATDSHGNS